MYTNEKYCMYDKWHDHECNSDNPVGFVPLSVTPASKVLVQPHPFLAHFSIFILDPKMH